MINLRNKIFTRINCSNSNDNNANNILKVEFEECILEALIFFWLDIGINVQV